MNASVAIDSTTEAATVAPPPSPRTGASSGNSRRSHALAVAHARATTSESVARNSGGGADRPTRTGSATSVPPTDTGSVEPSARITNALAGPSLAWPAGYTQDSGPRSQT